MHGPAPSPGASLGRRAAASAAVVVAMLASLLIGAPSASAHADYALVVSTSSARSAPVPLQGAVLSGDAYIFSTPDLEVTKAAFYLDDPQRLKAPRRYESLAPFDFNGGSVAAATPWSTTTVADGLHTVTVVLTTVDQGPIVLSATFTVSNGAAGLSASPSTAALSGVAGGAASSASVQVAATNGSAAVLSATEPASWLTTSLSSGTTPAALTLTASPAGLAAGTYTTTVTLSAPGYTGTSVPVTYTVTAAPAQWSLQVSSRSDRGSPSPLAGTSLSGPVYVFVGPSAGLSKVEFWIDSPALTGTPRRVENLAPWDLAGGTASAATAFDMSTLSPGAHSVQARLTRTDGTRLVLESSFTVAAPGSTSAGVPTRSAPELIFSAVKGTVSATRSVSVQNTGSAPLRVTGLALTGTHAAAFRAAPGAPALPVSVAVGASITIPLEFAPASTLSGPTSALLTVSTDSGTRPTVGVGLYGLSTNGIEGTFEPPLAQVVEVLGHRINVGGTALSLGTSVAPIGDEVAAPLFTRATAAPVTVTPVARYSPNGTVAFGWYRPGTTLQRSPLATIATGQHQALLPSLTAGGTTSFDPGTAAFGLWSLPSSINRYIYSEDALNTGVPHAVRVYPARDRGGLLIPNTYLVGFEEAQNGDYQDYLYRITNVVPAPPGSTPPAVVTGTFAWTPATPSPLARFESNGVVVGSTAYVLGGFVDTALNTTTRSDAYDVATGTWRRLADMPEPTTHAATAFDGRYVWVIGGYVGQHPGGSTTNVWKYDTRTGTWAAGPSLPAPRGAGAAAYVGGRIHYVGGTNRVAGTTTDADQPDHWSVALTGGPWRTESPLPTPRNHLGAAAVGDVLYVVGGQLGHFEGAPLATVEAFDVVTGRWSTAAPLPVARGHIVSSTFAKDGRIIVVGGSGADWVASAAVHSYDPSSNSWRALPSLPGGRKSPVAGDVGGRLVSTTGNSGGTTATAETWTAPMDTTWTTGTASPVALGEVAGGVIGGVYYVVGEGTSATLAYDLGARTWRTSGLAVRPFVGHHHAAEVIGGKLWLFGGLGGSSGGKVQVYDPVTNAWTTRADMPFAAGSSATAVIGGKVYVAGGIVGTATTTATAVYDPATNTWTSLAPMKQGRNHAAAATDGTRLWVFGGRGPGSGDGNVVANGFDTVQVFDPSTGAWRSSADAGSTLAPLPQGRGGMGKAVFAGGEMYVLGGETSTGAGATAAGVYSRVDVYDVAAGTWRSAPSMPTARHGMFPVLQGGAIHVLLGGTKSGFSQSTVVETYTLT